MTVGLTLVRYGTMPTEIWVALITGGVSVIGFLLTFIISNKKLKTEQSQKMIEYNEKLKNQIATFQEDTRDEISKLQDAFAEHKVEIQQAINELQASQQQMQATIALRLGILEKKQDQHNNLIERVYEIEKHVAVIEEKEKIN